LFWAHLANYNPEKQISHFNVITVMVNVSSDTIKHASYAKGLYFHALQHIKSDSILDRAICVINLDGAVETFLYAVANHIGAEVSERASFKELLAPVKNEFKVQSLDDALLQQISLNKLRRARNDAEHHGMIPCTDDLERYKSVAYQVLSALSEKILQKRFEEISLSALIKDDIVKALYKHAEERYYRADYVTALISSASAFEKAKNIEQGQLFGSGILLSYILSPKDNRNNLDVIINELEVLKLRLDYKKYQKYREIFNFIPAPFTSVEGTNTREVFDNMKALLSSALASWDSEVPATLKEKATFCVGFSLESILTWETIAREGWPNRLKEVSSVRFYQP